MTRLNGPLLDVQELSVQFATANGVLHAVSNVSFTLHRGEVLGVVGESGSGKSVTATALLGLHPPLSRVRVTGRALLDGQDLIALPESKLRKLRGTQIGYVFQDPLTGLNPAMTVGAQLIETLRHRMGMSRSDARRRAGELLDLVRIPNARARLGEYPDQFSGGMRQRILIAMAVSCQPQMLVADEATTALDPTVQIEILSLLADVRKELNMALMLISHDFGVVAAICDRTQVMYAGRIVEAGSTTAVLEGPRHPYTAGLLRLAPRFEANHHGRLRPIPGRALTVIGHHVGCRFRSRCEISMEPCAGSDPPWVEGTDAGHGAACWRDVDDVRQFALAADEGGNR